MCEITAPKFVSQSLLGRQTFFLIFKTWINDYLFVCLLKANLESKTINLLILMSISKIETCLFFIIYQAIWFSASAKKYVRPIALIQIATCNPF